MKFESAYFETTIQHFNHYAMRTFPLNALSIYTAKDLLFFIQFQLE